MPAMAATLRGIPRAARIYDHILGGSDSIEADRAVAAALKEAYGTVPDGRTPVPQEMAVHSARFTGRAVAWAARQGIRQFCDVSPLLPVSRTVTAACGRPETVRPVHEAVAGELGGGETAAVAYVPGDVLVAAHARSAVRGVAGVTVADGNPLVPARVVPALAQAGTLDVTRPVAVVMSRLLAFTPPGQARTVAAGWMRLMPPGSCLVVSCGWVPDPGTWARVQAACTPRAWNHGPDVMASFLGGLDPVPPGVTSALAWKPGWPGAVLDGTPRMLAAVGVKR